MFPAQTDIRVLTTAQMVQGQPWRLSLVHDRPAHQLIWITRGQGRALLNGQRRGIGAHNALFVPAHALFSMDMNRQSLGHVVLIPEATALHLPATPCHLRIRDVTVQSTLTGLVEAALREDQGGQPLRSDAVEGYAALMSVWLRRQMIEDDQHLDPENAAARISRKFCERLPQSFRSGDGMGAYAQSLNVSATHLTRAVKAATGRTAAELLSERILHEARRLLHETSQPAQNIARFLGFGSPAYFTRFIKQHTGRPPSRLRGTCPQKTPMSQMQE